MIEYTPAEIRARYREIGGKLPDDEMLIYRHGDATTGAAMIIAPERLSALDEVIAGIRQEGNNG